MGLYLIQMAKQKGANIWVTCGERSVDMVKSLGADYIIDYKNQKLTDVSVLTCYSLIHLTDYQRSCFRCRS